MVNLVWVLANAVQGKLWQLRHLTHLCIGCIGVYRTVSPDTAIRSLL